MADFIPKSPDIEKNIVRKLATVENIDWKVAGETLIYTVPSGARLITLGLVIKPVVLENLIGDGIAYLRRGSDEKEIIAQATPDLEEADMFLNRWFDNESVGNVVIINSGDTLKIVIDPPETGEALTFDVDLIGYLIEE